MKRHRIMNELQGIILMEDLTRRGADVVDVARGLSEEQVRRTR